MQITFTYYHKLDGVTVFAFNIVNQFEGDADYPVQQMLEYDNFEPAYNLAVSAATDTAFGHVSQTDDSKQTHTAELVMFGVTEDGTETMEGVTIANYGSTANGMEVTDFVRYGTSKWDDALEKVAAIMEKEGLEIHERV